MSSQHLGLLLRALQFSGSAPAGPDTEQQYRNVIAWLENTKIRQLAQENRKGLLSTHGPEWQIAFQEYLLELDCPIQLAESKASSPEILEWLLHLAISLAYQDNEALMQSESSAAKPQQISGKSQPLLQDWSVQFREKLAAIKAQLQIASTSTGQVDDLQVARDVIVEQLLPSVESSQVGQRSREAAQQLASLNPDTFPLGFATGDPKVDLAATIMRMLFIKDLRQLQTLVDETLVQVQEYTANPKTDSALGRLGR